MRKLTAYFTIIVFLSCSSNKSEIQRLEATLGLALPMPYKILQVNKETIGSDYAIKIILEFEDSSFDSLSRYIAGTPLFNCDYSLHKTDSIKALVNTYIGKTGFWISTENTFHFIQVKNFSEPIECTLAKDTRKMTYQFSHL